jgi:hypothetical protein
MKTWRIGVMVVIGGACGDDGAVGIDAPTADTAPPVPTCYLDSATPAPSCDFSCTTVAWPTTAPDPVLRKGSVSGFAGTGPLGGANVEVRTVTGDALIGQTTTGSGPSTLGKYTMSIATGGVAPTLYTKATMSGLLDGYEYDPYPTFEAAAPAFGHNVLVVDAATLDELYQQAGVDRDPAMGTIQMQALDCLERAVAGVTATVEDAVVKYNSGAGGTIASPFAVATDSSATIWVFNAPTGPLDVTIHAGELTYRALTVGSFANSWSYALRLP